jgi:hypothetical protein
MIHTHKLRSGNWSWVSHSRYDYNHHCSLCNKIPFAQHCRRRSRLSRPLIDLASLWNYDVKVNRALTFSLTLKSCNANADFSFAPHLRYLLVKISDATTNLKSAHDRTITPYPGRPNSMPYSYKFKPLVDAKQECMSVLISRHEFDVSHSLTLR